ncbi:hypothetical protein KBD20_00260 [Candidatus Saccharibacteria bacterium]|nr:hypothetical protein [Candidatus Saccharibacteria bacterium]
MNDQNKNILVVKVGTNTLIQKSGSIEQLNLSVFSSIASQLQTCSAQGYDIVIVSSGAITAGMVTVGSTERARSMVGQQRHAGIGWPKVAAAWDYAFGDKVVFSTLLTRRELGGGQSTRHEALGVILYALTQGDIVLVNENDVITHEEIEFGDNDTLAATLAAEIAKQDASSKVTLLLLTDINGLRVNKEDESSLIKIVDRIEDVAAFGEDSRSNASRGGMITKIRAATIARESGVETYIADGKERNVVARALAGEIGTHFRVQ